MTLTDTQWSIIAPHCLGRECDPGRTGPDPRFAVIICVIWQGVGVEPFRRIGSAVSTKVHLFGRKHIVNIEALDSFGVFENAI